MLCASVLVLILEAGLSKYAGTLFPKLKRSLQLSVNPWENYSFRMWHIFEVQRKNE